MKPVAAMAAGSLLTLVAGVAAGLGYVVTTGLGAKAQPPAAEARVARAVRGLAVPRSYAQRANPVSLSPDVLAAGLAHYADHCASCHGADGSGQTELGMGLYPKAPDMRAEATQRMTDGELFYVIEHGIRFTGMPGWSTGTPDGETASWQLVRVIRHLPRMTDDEKTQVEQRMPRSPDEIRQEIAEEQFLSGGDAPETAPATEGAGHTGH
jgi:mono/diheme cytochrome c family protein